MRKALPMSSGPRPPCRSIQVIAFHGDRSRAFVQAYYKKLGDEKAGTGPRPSLDECLRFAGHTGVSIDGGKTIFGFNPNPDPKLQVWQLMDSLKNGDKFDSLVRDDTRVFSMATGHQLALETIEVRLPDAHFQTFKSSLDAERPTTQYTYSFPDGLGDCNCITWLERLGLPLVTGSMDEFIDLLQNTLYPSRRFGDCT